MPPIPPAGAGGTLLETNKTTVRWVAPAQSEIFDISVSASNSVSQSALTNPVFVGDPVSFIPQRAGETHLDAVTGGAFYLSALIEPGQPGFSGLHLRSKVGASDMPVSNDLASVGFQFDLSNDLQWAVMTHVVFTTPRRTVNGDSLARNQCLGRPSASF